MNSERLDRSLRYFVVAGVCAFLGCRSVPLSSESVDDDDPLTPSTRVEAATPEHAGTGPVGVIGGQIRDSSGRPIPGARVMLLGDLDDEERRFLHWWVYETVCTLGLGEAIASEAAAMASTETDANGAYSFSGLADGAYLLRVTAPGFGFSEEKVTLVAAGAPPPLRDR